MLQIQWHSLTYYEYAKFSILRKEKWATTEPKHKETKLTMQSYLRL